MASIFEILKKPITQVTPLVQPRMSVLPAEEIEKNRIKKIIDRKEELKAAPAPSKAQQIYQKFVPEPIKSAVKTVKEGFMGSPKVDIQGETVFKSGIKDYIPFNWAFIPKPKEQKFSEAFNKIKSDGISDERAGKIADILSGKTPKTTTLDPTGTLSRINQDKEIKQNLAALNLDEMEQKAVKSYNVSKFIENSLNALDFVGIGSIAKQPTKALFTQIAKSTDEGAIKTLLKSELPAMSDDVAEAFAKGFKPVDDPKEVEKIFTGLYSKYLPEGQIAKNEIVPFSPKSKENPLSFIQKPIDEVVKDIPTIDPKKPEIKPFLKKDIRTVISQVPKGLKDMIKDTSTSPVVGKVSQGENEFDVRKTGELTPSTVSKELQPLVEEAKKYKSAEEFIASKISEKQIKPKATEYVQWNNISKNISKGDPGISSNSDDEFMHEFVYRDKNGDPIGILKLNDQESLPGAVYGKSATISVKPENQKSGVAQALLKHAQTKGFDTTDYLSSFDNVYTKEGFDFTKKQLTDIYNQATKGGGQSVTPLKEAMPSPEEMINDITYDYDAVEAFSTNKNFKPDMTTEEAKETFRGLFDPSEVGFIFTDDFMDVVLKGKRAKAVGLFTKKEITKDMFRSLVKVVQDGGKVSSDVVYHEAFHAYFNNFVSPEESAKVLGEVKKKLPYIRSDYDAEEWLADDFARYVKEKKESNIVLRSFYDNTLFKIRGWVRKVSQAEAIYNRILERDRSVKRDEPTETQNAKEAESPDDLSEGPTKITKEDLDIQNEKLARHKAHPFLKYVNQRTTRLPEILKGYEGVYGREMKALLEKKKLTFEEAQDLVDDYRFEMNHFQDMQQRFIDDMEGKADDLSGEFGEDGELTSIGNVMDNLYNKEGKRVGASSPEKMIDKDGDINTPVGKKVNMIDYIRTPDRVLNKVGLGDEARLIKKKYEDYLDELPKNLEKITEWQKRVPSKEDNREIFMYLDGKLVDGNGFERQLYGEKLAVAKEIQAYLTRWADRLDLPDDERISHYITHIFENDFIKKEFDEDLAKIIDDKIPRQVYDPFLENRMGAKGYKQDTWAALDAYTKRATRKVHMDVALERLKIASEKLPIEVEKYIKRYADRINMRPTEIDTLIDNFIKSTPIGYKLGQRPIANLTREMRKMVYRGTLGLNIGSAIRNLSQVSNTYAKLGEKYTILGYYDLLKRATSKRDELKEVGVLRDDFIQDRGVNAIKKTMDKVDKALFVFFDAAEKVNRGAAYFGAKRKFYDKLETKNGMEVFPAGVSPEEFEKQAIEYAKNMVEKTQFSFGSIDTPVGLQGDLVKTIIQLQGYTLKQTEFLAEMVKNKEFGGLLRYALAMVTFVFTVGSLVGMDLWDSVFPKVRFQVPIALKPVVSFIGALINAPDAYGKPRDLSKKASDLGKTLIPFVPAGSQIKKTYEGIKAVLDGGSFDKADRKQYDVDSDPFSAAQASLFGKNATPQAREYYEKKFGKDIFSLSKLKLKDGRELPKLKKPDVKKLKKKELPKLKRPTKLPPLND